MNLFGKSDKQSIGQQAEEIAYAHLRKQGLKLIQRNYRCKEGEIDLIMQECQTLVFVEVRYRSDEQYGGSIESINWQKQQRIIKTAQRYLQTHPQAQYQVCRFDVVLLASNNKITWITDAFRLN